MANNRRAGTKTKRIFSRIYFALIACGVTSIAVYWAFSRYNNEQMRRPLSFRAAIVKMQLKHGAANQYFLDLSNGQHYFFTLPAGISRGDSIIKNAGESWFTAKTRGGEEVGRISLQGKPMVH